MKFYAGVGSRKTPAEILDMMRFIAGLLADEGWTLRSGGADGADTAFEDGARLASGPVRIYLPADGFNGHQADTDRGVLAPKQAWALEAAAVAHPNWDACSMFAKRAHTRNVHQVLGHEQYIGPDRTIVPMERRKSAFVLCWTPDGAVVPRECTQETGGTGQAIRIAFRAGVPVFNLRLADHRTRVSDWLAGHRVPFVHPEAG